MTSPLRRSIFIVCAGAWLGAVGLGFRELTRFENTPGMASTPPASWPRGSTIPRDAARPTLVMLVHPGCSCSRASIGELALLMTQARGLATARVLFFLPTGFPESWARNDLWSAAAAIPGVRVQIDPQGKQAKLFHASTSGAVMLYDRDGRLIFNGGITASRSHSGDNAGRTAVVSLLTRGSAERNKTFVFGCSILDSRTAGELP